MPVASLPPTPPEQVIYSSIPAFPIEAKRCGEDSNKIVNPEQDKLYFLNFKLFL